MDSLPPPLPPQQAKPEGRPANSPARPTNHPANRAQSYPKPPALLPRLVMLVLRPETWPEMARYPTRFTITPLILAVIISALATGIHASYQSWQSFHDFAATYSARYPDLEITSDGTLTAKGDLPNPIRFESGQNSTILVDPTGKTVPDTLKSDGAILITNKEIWIVGEDANFRLAPLSRFTSMMLEPGTKQLINTETLKAYLASNAAGMMISPVIVIGSMSFLASALWAAFTTFLICPLVMLAAAGPRLNTEGPDRRLLFSRRAAYRMAAAIMIPLTLLGGLLQVLNRPVSALIGGQGSMLFWFFAAGGLAIWTGIMARKMYGPTPRVK